eukprot:scaffold80116_cov17-Tisochrysis_lutea.AAC.1
MECHPASEGERVRLDVIDVTSTWNVLGCAWAWLRFRSTLEISMLEPVPPWKAFLKLRRLEGCFLHVFPLALLTE